MKGNLLIVDDEELILENLAFLLEDYADEILKAKNGLSALKIIEENTVHCVICDLTMPKMDGLELIKATRKRSHNIPFIFYTGAGSHEMMLKVEEFGAFEYLHKPLFDGMEDSVIRALHLGLTQQKSIESDYKGQFKKLLADRTDYS